MGRQKAESRPQKFQTKIRSDFLLFVMIVHKASQTVLSVFFAAVVAIVSARGPQTVTCGSVVKLMNVHRSIRLHSHDVKRSPPSGTTATVTPVTFGRWSATRTFGGATTRSCSNMWIPESSSAPRGKPLAGRFTGRWRSWACQCRTLAPDGRQPRASLCTHQTLIQ